MNRQSLIEDQAFVLDQIVELARSERVDAVLVSGDLYDRAVPPPDAVRLLDDVLSRLVLDLKIPVVAIAGNHDSPDRLSFASGLLSRQSFHLYGWPSRDALPVVLEDRWGTVHFHAVPYAEPPVVRQWLQAGDDVTDHDLAMRACLEPVWLKHPAGQRSVLLAHAFVAGGLESSDSERRLGWVGGAGTVEPGCFEGFDYVALGHLHRPQHVGRREIQYSGSPLKYSFGEADHRKGVNLVELHENGSCNIESVALRPRRDVRVVRGWVADILRNSPDPAEREDYVQVVLLDPGPILDAMTKIRAVYPNVLDLNLEHRAKPTSGPATVPSAGLSQEDLFQSFYRTVTGGDLNDAERAELRSALDSLSLEAQEVGA